MVFNPQHRSMTAFLMGLSLWFGSTAPLARGQEAAETVTTDLLIVGGTESGCAAAIQAARMGVQRIAVVNDIDWLGGQFSAESLTAFDENRSLEEVGRRSVRREGSFPRSGIFKELLDDIEATNVSRYGNPRPGNNAVMTNARPADAEKAFRKLITPYVTNGQIRLFSHFVPVSAEMADNGTRLSGITFQSTESPSRRLTVQAKLTIDASDWGDVIQLSGAAFEFGPDLQEKYGEPRAPTAREKYPVTDMNPITYCMVIEKTDQEHVVPRPPHYDERRYFNSTQLTRTEHGALPWPHPPVPAFARVSDVYASRRIVDSVNLKGVQGPDSILLCWFVQDYPLDILPHHVVEQLEQNEAGASRKNIVEMTRAQRQIIFDDAKQHSLGMLHHLQTTVHDRMEDKSGSFRWFQLSDEFGTSDRMPFKPYIRESLRLNAMYMMRQQDSTPVGPKSETFGRVMYHDGVAAWQFEYDFHMTGRTFLPGEEKSLAWQSYFKTGRTWGPPYAGLCLFPVRSLIPEKVDGLLGAQKNLGYSSIISSAIRLHDQCVAIGQSAGAAAAVELLNDDVLVRQIPSRPELLQQLREGLCSRESAAGVPMVLWPYRDLTPDHPAFVAVNLLSVSGLLPIGPDEVTFQPDLPATADWKREVREVTARSRQNVPELPDGAGQTRGEFASAWWNSVKSLPIVPFPRLMENDADGDGILDRDDPLPYNAEKSSFPQVPVRPHQNGLVEPVPQQTSIIPEGERRIQFAAKNQPAAKNFELDSGALFDAKRGFGWNRDLSGQFRNRGYYEESERDNFLFVRDRAVWECVVPNGRWLVTICVGDATHPQPGQQVTVEGVMAIEDGATRAGLFLEKTVEVTVRDGRLTIQLGPQKAGENTTLNWVRFVPLRESHGQDN